MMRNGTVVPLDAVEAEQPVRLVSRIGDALPLHCTAAGKMHLAFADDELRARAAGRAAQVHREDDRRSARARRSSSRRSRENGYAVDLGEYIEDVRSVAVPVRDYTRAVVGSLAISGPAYRLSQERIEKEVVPLMLKAGRELSTRLGFEANDPVRG